MDRSRRRHGRKQAEGWARGIPKPKMVGGTSLHESIMRGTRMGLSQGRARAHAELERDREVQTKMDARDGTHRVSSRVGAPPSIGSDTWGMDSRTLGSTGRTMRGTQWQVEGRGSAMLVPAPPKGPASTLGASTLPGSGILRTTGMAPEPPWDTYGPVTAMVGTAARPKRLDARAEDTCRHPSDPVVTEERRATVKFLRTPAVCGVTGQNKHELSTTAWNKTNRTLRAGVADETVQTMRPTSDSYRAPYWNVRMRDAPEKPHGVRKAAKAATLRARPEWIDKKTGKWRNPTATHSRRALATALPTPDAPFLPQFDTRARQIPHGRPQTMMRDEWGMHRADRPTNGRKSSPSNAERLVSRALAYSHISDQAKNGILQAKLARAQSSGRVTLSRTRLPPPGQMLAASGRTLPSGDPSLPRNRLPLKPNYFEPTSTRGLIIPGARTRYTAH